MRAEIYTGRLTQGQTEALMNEETGIQCRQVDEERGSGGSFIRRQPDVRARRQELFANSKVIPI